MTVTRIGALGAAIAVLGLCTAPAGAANTLSFAGQARPKVVDLSRGFWAHAARVEPMGDSNTHGWNKAIPQALWQSYRRPLFLRTVGAGLWIDFVGANQNGPADFDRDHDGISGRFATELVDEAGPEAAAAVPDVVLLVIGTNDALREADAADTVPGEVLEILKRIKTRRPSATILVGPLPPIDPTVATKFLANADEIRAAINAKLPGVVADAKALGIKAAFVPMPSLGTDDLTDGVHLSPQGHLEVANAWFASLASVLGTANGTFGGGRASAAGVANVAGSEGPDRIAGNAASNALSGRAGDDRLEGRGGPDRLAGGPGFDTFVWARPADGGDTVADFVSRGAGLATWDTLALSASGFGGGLVAGGPVPIVQGTNPLPKGAKGQLLLDTDDGRLRWDKDGAGPGAPVLIARLPAGKGLVAGDVKVER